LQLIVSARTDQGLVRPNNEDNFYVAEERDILVVADGMGGHASGEVASKMAIDIIRDSVHSESGENEPIIGKYNDDYSDVTNRIGSAMRLANMAIYEASQNDPRWQGMGTTLAAVAVNDKRLSIGHVGDSRVYLIRAGDIAQLTDDHTLVYEQVKREIMTKEEADVSDMKNLLTRAVGIRPEVEVDLDELTLADGDILILCTDGLSSMVTDDDILSVVISVEDPSVACDRLVDLANNNGGQDNITVIVAYLKKSNWLSSLFKLFEWFRR
jgi:serine/threonine protein phosphatase PrpC